MDQPPVRRSRRERELSSLYATARSLTALGELDDVLRSIVERAHDLIGTDLTYLSLLGPDGELRVHASEGTISADFIAAGIPPHAGLGGRVISRRAPVWVRNYLAARELEHDVAFDDLVVREGLVALLGVPLVVRDQVSGALFAADRAERDFTADEIALFGAFADHAAIALNNARLYDESQNALRELRRAYGVIEEHAERLELTQTVHEALAHIVLTGGGSEQVARDLADRIGGVVVVLGPDDVPTARAADRQADRPWAADTPLDQDVLPAEAAHVLDRARSSGRGAFATDAQGISHSAVVVQAGDSYLGALIWSRPSEPSDADLRMLERAAHIVGLMVLKENAAVDAAERVSGELLTELLVDGPTISADRRARARARGVDLDALSLLVVADAPSAAAGRLTRILHTVAREQGGIAGEHLGRSVALLPVTAEPDAVTSATHRKVRAALGRPVLVIGEQVSARSWGPAFTGADRCSRLAAALGHTDRGLLTAHFAPFALLFDTERAADLHHYLRDALGPLLDYDAQRSAELVKTATAYFDHHGNLAQTARDLHIHLNTLTKRLDRIGVLLGDGWRTTDALRVQLACRLQELRADQAATG